MEPDMAADGDGAQRFKRRSTLPAVSKVSPVGTAYQTTDGRRQLAGASIMRHRFSLP